ncbi:transposase IS200-family protein [Methanohalobium evestigatum Z-7303]|uniref:Transposase IS200-family protein n=1 Tax=Methanohalobium evestigatum (strain ATCC BAA-1072 / DSM 3721 / NBRC 107634 / OCM 161 / Z-7303) TaxID=644295 RepID=D7E9L4_METEZ|nr:transposase IS200-family protein [Methanohalobium evestigatum Z-7303]
MGFEDSLKDILITIASKSDFDIVEMECDKDHIHILVKSKPKISILSFIRKLKQESIYLIWKNHKKYLKIYYWNENTLWSDGYFCCTIGNISKKTITEYIRSQG